MTTTTDYAGQFVYNNNTLNFFGSPEGRTVRSASGQEYQYAIADHQGNTRVVFSSVTPAPIGPLATFEGNAADNASQYTNVNASNVVSFASANHTPSGVKVIRMNQAYKIGPAKSVKVYAGDKIDIEVWEYHEGSSGFGTTSTPSATLISMVASAFGGVNGGQGESGMIYSGVNNAVSGFVPAGNQGSTRPAAYLNYILFDQQYNVLDMGWQLVPAATFTKQKVSFSTLNIAEAGFMFVYLSYDNDSNNWVYFDDFKVTHTKSNVVQYNEFYSHGAQNANSWTRESNTGNNFLANGGTELNGTTQLYDLDFRNFDPVLARMHQVDPMASKYATATPYNFAFNNPVGLNDPTGADPPNHYFYNGSGQTGHPGYTYDDVLVETYLGDAIVPVSGAYGWLSGRTAVPMNKYWKPGDNRLHWSPFESEYRSITRDLDAVKFGDMSLEDYGKRHASDPTPAIEAALKSQGLESYEGGWGVWEDDDKSWLKGNVINVMKSKFVTLLSKRNTLLYRTNPQEWTPEFVNGVFGESFEGTFGSKLRFMYPADDAAMRVRQIRRLLSDVANNVDYYLVPEPSNPAVALMPVSYQIQSGEQVINVQLEKDNGSKLWGNPGGLTTEGIPTPIDYYNSDGSKVSLIIYFQRPFGF